MGLLSGIFTGGGPLMAIIRPLFIGLSAWGIFLCFKKSILLGLVATVLAATGVPAAIGGMAFAGVDVPKAITRNVKLPW